MKINVVIEGMDDMKTRLSEFGKSSSRILNKILRRVSVAYRKYVVSDYLSGQYLGVRTGKTKQSMITYKTKGEKNSYTIGSRVQMRGGETGYSTSIVGLASIYEHVGGVDIKPRAAKVLAWVGPDGQMIYRPSVHLNPKPFMTDSSNRYDFEGVFQSSADQTIDEEVAKQGLS